MATFVVIHGAGGRGSDWRFVASELESRGHEVLTPDLPCEDPVGLDGYVDEVLAAIGDRRDELVLVAHSLGGLTAPLVASRIPVDTLIFVTAMVPVSGERGSEWWDNTGHGDAYRAQGLPDESEETIFLHDVPAEVLAASDPPRDQAGEVLDDPCPIDAWPEVPTTFLVCRDDRFFPAAWMTDVVRTRLGIEPIVVPGAHCPYLSQPVALADAIEQAWRARSSARPVRWAPAP